MNELDAPGPIRYYEELGRAHDYLLRCKDCRALVTFHTIQKFGVCHQCGNRRFTEITILSEQEMTDLTTGKIDFPDRELFLREFSAVDTDAVTQ